MLSPRGGAAASHPPLRLHLCSWVFWTVLYVTPVVWGLLGFIALLKLNLEYLLLVVIAFLLAMANLLGYIKVGRQGRQVSFF